MVRTHRTLLRSPDVRAGENEMLEHIENCSWLCRRSPGVRAGQNKTLEDTGHCPNILFSPTPTVQLQHFMKSVSNILVLQHFIIHLFNYYNHVIYSFSFLWTFAPFLTFLINKHRTSSCNLSYLNKHKTSFSDFFYLNTQDLFLWPFLFK